MSDAARYPRWLRPRVVLPSLAVIVVALTLLAPERGDPRAGDARLTTYSPSPLGARLLWELAGRLGWPVERLVRRDVPRDPSAVVVLLDPPVAPRGAQVHALLEHVRRGGGLVLALGDDAGAIGDSLGVRHGGSGNALVRSEHRPKHPRCPTGLTGPLPLWPTPAMQLWRLGWRRGVPRDTVVFADVLTILRSEGGTHMAPAAAGWRYGRGRVVVVADADLLRNDVLRTCVWGADVAAVRMLEYASGGPGRRPRVVFDEWHQGFGAHPSAPRAVRRFLWTTPAGHALLQLALAGLLLVAARGVRLVPPVDASRVARRSPLEHVQALARAYEQVGATRTIAARLVHGVRRRAARGAGDADPERFLDWAERRAPTATGAIAILRAALARATRPRDLPALGEAAHALETALVTRTPSSATVSTTTPSSTAASRAAPPMPERSTPPT